MKKRNTMTWVLSAIILVVLALGVYAVYGTLADNFEARRISKAAERVQTGEATVEELADVQGITVDELLTSYGVTEEDAISEGSSMMEFAEKLTLAKYCEFAGLAFTEADFAEYKAANGIADDVTVDTKDAEIKAGFTAYIYEKQLAAESAEQPAAE